MNCVGMYMCVQTLLPVCFGCGSDTTSKKGCRKSNIAKVVRGSVEDVFSAERVNIKNKAMTIVDIMEHFPNMFSTSAGSMWALCFAYRLEWASQSYCA